MIVYILIKRQTKIKCTLRFSVFVYTLGRERFFILILINLMDLI